VPLRQGSTAVHAYALMRDMKPGERFDIEHDVLRDMDCPRDHVLDVVDAQYVIDKLQQWLPFKTEVLVDILTGKVTFCRAEN
jgi:hypothetical protein